MPRFEQLYPKGIHSAYIFRHKLPLIHKTTAIGLSLKTGHSHDKIINKFDRDLNEATIHIVVPFLKYYKIFFAGLDII